MNERFVVETVMITDCCTDESRVVEVITDEQELHTYEELSEIKDLLNEQQKFIDLLFNELLNAQKQGYVLNCTHQMERCSLIPKEIEDE